MLGNYRLISVIGHGSFGQVYKACHKDEKRIVALKHVAFNPADDTYDYKREIDTHMRVPPHRNIVQLLDRDVQSGSIIIVMELCTFGDLDSYMKSKNLTLCEKIDLMQQASNGILHLHSCQVVHRDIKPKNMLLEGDMTDGLVLKIADFGFAKFVEESNLGTPCGTPSFLAPEIKQKEETGVDYTRRCDIFSLGVVFQAMALFKDGDKSLRPALGKFSLKHHKNKNVQHSLVPKQLS